MQPDRGLEPAKANHPQCIPTDILVPSSGTDLMLETFQAHSVSIDVSFARLKTMTSLKEALVHPSPYSAWPSTETQLQHQEMT